MSLDKVWHIDQQLNTPKQSPITTEDTSNYIETSKQLRNKAQQIENKEKQDNENKTNEALWITPVNWKDKETSIRESGIDFKSQIAQIDIKITQTQTKIDLILQKGNLSEEDQLKYLTLEENIEKLTAEKDIIKQSEGQQLDKKVAIKKSEELELDKNLNKKKNENEIKKEQLSEKSIKILDKTNRMKSSINSLPNSNHKENILTLIDSMNESTNDTGIENYEKQLIAYLQKPWVLKSVSDDLGWADENNPKYVEFKKSMIAVDRSFIPYFEDLENIEIGTWFSTDEIIEWIELESGGMVDIDLKSKDPTSKYSLIGGKYEFEDTLDREEIDEIMLESKEELEHLRSDFSNFQEFETSYSTMRDGLRNIWWKPNFKEGLKTLSQAFSRDVFDGLKDTYENLDIPLDMQLKESDISTLSNNINDDWDLAPKMTNITEKMDYLQTEIKKTEVKLVQKHKTELKELLQRTSENKEKQLETLKFLKASGFDEIPKWISNRIIKEVQGNVLTIPWLNLAKENIDLKNGNFWESWAFSGKENGLNIESKSNLVKLVNKIISWDVNEPLWVEAIASGVIQADPRLVRSKLTGATIKWRVSWNYGKVIGNLKKENPTP